MWENPKVLQGAKDAPCQPPTPVTPNKKKNLFNPQPPPPPH